jgi:hypothetical protein
MSSRVESPSKLTLVYDDDEVREFHDVPRRQGKMRWISGDRICRNEKAWLIMVAIRLVAHEM